MNTYRVKFQSVAYVEIEASSASEALEIADNYDLDAEQCDKLGWALYSNAEMATENPIEKVTR